MLALQMEGYNIYQVIYGVAGDGLGTVYIAESENIILKEIKVPAYTAEDASTHMRLYLSNLYSNGSFRVVSILPVTKED